MLTQQEYTAKIQDVGERLPGNWSFDFNPDSWNWGCKLVDSRRDIGIFFSLDRDRKKIEISGMIPRDNKGQMPHIGMTEVLPKIRVSAAKTSAQIANDIEKRFLPVWLPRLAKMHEDIARSEDYRNKTKSLAERIAKVVQCKAEGKHISFYRSPFPVFNESMSSAEVHADDVTLELRLPPDDAVALLKWMTNQ